MDATGWQTRLIEGIRAKGKSQREVSIASGNGPGYVNSLVKEGKDPTIGNLLDVCRAAGLSLYEVLYGVRMDRETEEIIRELEKVSGGKRKALLQILRDETD